MICKFGSVSNLICKPSYNKIIHTCRVEDAEQKFN